MTAPTAQLTVHRYPGATFGSFVLRRSLWSMGPWAGVAVVYHYLSVVGFLSIGPSAESRLPTLTGFESSAGLTALIGDPRGITEVGAYLDWRVVGVVSLIGSVWAVLSATRWLRGEEVTGRWEQVLAAPTSAGATTLRVLGGLGAGVLLLMAVTAAGAVSSGRAHDVVTPVGSALLLGLVLGCPAAMFLAVAALVCQCVPTLGRARALSAVVLGGAFVLRAVGDIAPGAGWVAALSPLGWVERVHPLSGPRPVWLLPVALLTAGATALGVRLAGRRDLGTGLVRDRDSAASHTRLLSHPLLLAVRTTRGSAAGWLIAAFAASALFGSLTRSAQTAVGTAQDLGRLTSGLVDSSVRARALAYAGVVFLLVMTLLMAYVVSAAGDLRETESTGRLDNLLVRTVSRTRWLTGRLVLAVTVLAGAGLLSGLGFWIGCVGQGAGLTLGRCLAAGLNACAPAVLLLGLAVLAFGVIPRQSVQLAWLLLAWSFLVQMLSGTVDLDQWVRDTSLLEHVVLAPASDPSWGSAGGYVLLGLVAAAGGTWAFGRRDLTSD